MKLAAEGRVVLYGIDYKDKPEDAIRLLSQYGDPYRRIGVDRGGRTFIDFGAYGVPETYVIDKEGRIRRRFVGPLSERQVTQELLPLVQQLRRS